MIDTNTTGQAVNFGQPSKVAPMIGVVLILLSVALYVLYTRNLAANVAVSNADLVVKNQQLQDLTARYDSLQKAEQDMGLTTQVQKFEILKSVPVSMDQDQVIRDVVAIAKNYSIELHSISFGKGGSAQEGVGTLTVNASFEGNYSDLISFLQGIEQNSRLFKVTSVSVQINSLEISAIKRATFSLSLESYYQQESATTNQ